MNQQERCLWLIKALLKDMPQYAGKQQNKYALFY